MAASGLALASGGTAEASSTYAHLCLDSEFVCAQAEGSGYVVDMEGDNGQDITNWYYPTSGYQEISQADTKLCMEVDAAGGDVVIEATCAGLASERWERIPVGTDVFGETYYILQSDWDPSLCLAYNEEYGWLVADTCNGNDWYEDFVMGD